MRRTGSPLHRPLGALAILLVLGMLAAGCRSQPPASAKAPQTAGPGADQAASLTVAPVATALAASAPADDATGVPASPAPSQAPGQAPVATLSIVKTPLPLATPQNVDRTENILVLGMDTRPEMEAWRTDTIMVVAIDRNAGQVGIVSLPRDLYVNIPGYGQERINAADYIGEKMHYPGGGPALARRVVQETIGIPTQHYVRLKQDGIIKMVDALGGVEVTLTCPLYEEAPEPRSPTGYKQLALPAGKVKLDGPTAKQFVTYRYLTSDFGREKRQQQLIWAIRNRALKGDVLPRLPELWSALSDTFTSDLGLMDVIQLAGLGIKLQGKDIHATSLGYDVLQNYTTADGGQVLLLRDPATVRARLGQLFSAAPLSEVGQPAAGSGCPKPPPGFPDLTPAATPMP